MTPHTSTVASCTPAPVPPAALAELRVRDDAGRAARPFTAGAPDAPLDCVGSPLRCCLRPAEAGERVALVAYAPLRRWAAACGADPGAYDETGPVFIHAEPCAQEPPRGYPFTRPGALRTLRRYNSRGRIVGGRLVELPEDPGPALDAALAEAFTDPDVALVHVRAVEFGCFHYEVRRPAH